MGINKKNDIINLCDGYKKNGMGTCPNPYKCKKFHPRKFCSKSYSCNKNFCPFLHHKEYYICIEVQKFQEEINKNQDHLKILGYIGI